MPPAGHPLWGILRGWTLLGALALILSYGYDSWDSVKDPRTLIVIAILQACGEAIPFLGKFFKKPE